MKFKPGQTVLVKNKGLCVVLKDPYDLDIGYVYVWPKDKPYPKDDVFHSMPVKEKDVEVV